jgi:cardiolipin synthase
MYRHLPNLISSARLFAGPVLLWLAVTRQETAFSAMLIAALVSDVADGLVARVFKLQSKLGAMLDSTADVMTLSIAAYGIWVFHPDAYREHAVAGAAVIGCWLAVCAVALLRYGRLSSFHTYFAKATGYALGFFLAALFAIGFVPWLFYPMAALSVICSIEELALLWYVPDWRTDVRGLWWVLRDRRRAADDA